MLSEVAIAQAAYSVIPTKYRLSSGRLLRPLRSALSGAPFRRAAARMSAACEPLVAGARV